jgi:predicted N-acyltransferase
MKIFYKSNFTLEEQLSSIRKNFKKETPVSFTFLNKSFQGFSDNNKLLLTVSNKQIKQKEKLLFLSNIEILKIIFKKLSSTQIHRNFKIKITSSMVIIKDILNNEEFYYPNNFKIEEEISFLFDSRFFYYFRLNNKTLTKKSNFIITENFYGLDFKRKNKQILFLLKFS